MYDMLPIIIFALLVLSLGLLIMLCLLYHASAKERVQLYNRLQSGTLADYVVHKPQIEPERRSLLASVEEDIASVYEEPLDDGGTVSIAEAQRAFAKIIEQGNERD